GDARPDGASCQHAEESLQVLPEPGGMPSPHRIDRVDADALAARQPTQQPPPYIHAPNPHQDGGQATLRLDARRVAIGAEQATTLKGREGAAIAVLADAVEDDVEPARQNAREVFAFIIDRRGPEFADQRCVRAARGAPQLEAGQSAEHEQRLTDGASGSLHEHALS